MKKAISMILSFLIISNAHSASTDLLSSGPFYLEDATVAPKSFRYILLKSLPENRGYNITCDIENPNYSKPYPVVIKAEVNTSGVVSQSEQILLNHLTTKYTKRLQIGYQFKDPKLIFTNYDENDLIFIKNCMATYNTN